MLYIYLKAAALLSPLIIEGDYSDLKRFVRKFHHIDHPDLLTHYLLFTKYKFYCKLSHSKRKALIKSINVPGILDVYEDWKYYYNKLYKDYVKTKKGKPEDDPIYHHSIKFINYCLDNLQSVRN